MKERSEINRFGRQVDGKQVDVVELCDPMGRPTRHYVGRVDGHGVFAGKKHDCVRVGIATADGRLPMPKSVDVLRSGAGV